jgi:mannose/fructose/N-acetylgalactosamine-specific phosphotransferase system component IIC
MEDIDRVNEQPQESLRTELSPEPVDVNGQAPAENKAWGIAIAGWLLPGLGHALQKMWGRAVIVFLTVGLLVVAGALMRGNLFTARGSDAFDTLGYVADLGTGSFYFLARSLERNGADVSHAGGDYGTRFLATAGVLNLLAALHAYEAARGRKA